MIDSASDDLLTAIEGPIARITFNRPGSRNAVNAGMLRKMGGFLTEVAGNRKVRCVILTGAGAHFMAGGDVTGFLNVFDMPPEERRQDFIRRVREAEPIFHNLLTMPQPAIASIRGACAGAAVGFASCCDFILACESAFFLIAQVHIGASPDGATTYALPRKIGPAKALEMALLGGRVAALEAHAIGLVNRLVADDALEEETEKLARQICNLPATSARNIKNLYAHSMNNSLQQQLQLEAESMGDCAATADFIEGVSSFIEKRKAEFNKG